MRPVFFALVLLLVYWVSRKIGVVMLALAALVFIGIFGLMELASPDLLADDPSIILCVVFGIPLGIFMSASDAVDRAVKPILDLMQTMPSFVYLIPVLILFGVSPVAGLIAVVIYAMPPVEEPGQTSGSGWWCRSRWSRPATPLARLTSSASSVR